MLDLYLSFLGLVVLSPVLLLISFLVRFRLGSPVLFRQERPGFGGMSFTLLKFRTMRDLRNWEENLLPDDARLSGFGTLLRRLSFDELPELYNVLKGDMSLVGPRPLLVQYLDRYTPAQARRHEVRPGITGWAQVNGRNAITWEEKFALDVWYVDNQSFWLDLKILAMTAWKVLKREGISAQGEATMPEFMGTIPPAGKSEYAERFIVVGAGGHAKVVVDALLASGNEVLGFYDDNPALLGAEPMPDVKVLGDTKGLPGGVEKGKGVAILAVGENRVRHRMSRRLSVPYGVACAPSAVLGRGVRIGKGSMILPSATVNIDTVIGEHVILNTSCSVDHDCAIGDFVHIAPGAHLGGGVVVGEGTFLGLGSSVIPGIRIGRWSVIGAGAVVTKDIPDNCTAVGVPAKVIKTREEGWHLA